MSTATMRAKMRVMEVTAGEGYERLKLCAVGTGQPYNADGTGDEDNTFSRWTPQANLDMTIQNPALFGQFKAGDKFYVDFTPAA